MERKLIIAIDGYASCGKSTLAKQLAKALQYKYIDTGAMYRAVTYFALQKGIISNGKIDINLLISQLDKIDIDFEYLPKENKNITKLNGVNVEDKIRTPEVSEYVSEIAAIKEVRQRLVTLQRKMGENGGIVMDGRDIGTVVFPNADLKIFLTAKPEIRAKRRYIELKNKGLDVSYDEVLQNVLKRDKIDSTREITPLKQADDAIYFDNSNISIAEQFEMFKALIKTRFSISSLN